MPTPLLLTHRQFLFFRHDLQQIPLLAPPALPGAQFIEASLIDLDSLRDYEDEVFTRDDIRRKLQFGEHFFMIRIEGEAAWFGWARAGRFLHTPIDQWFSLPDDCMDIFGIYTKPRWRSHGLAKWGYRQMLELLRGRGVRQAYVQVETWNTASRRAIVAAQFLPYLRLRVWRCGRRKLMALRELGTTAEIPASRRLLLRSSAHHDPDLNQFLYPAPQEIPVLQ